MATGIRKLHSRACRSYGGGRCNCGAGWEASVYSPRDGKKIRKTFAREGEARSWRADAARAVTSGALRSPTRITLRQAADAWLAGAEAGEIRNRSGQLYKPSTLRGYRRALEDRVLPAIGGERLANVTTSDLQELVDRWQGEGQPASTLRNAIKPLQAIYRRAASRGGLPVNPTRDLELPASNPQEVEIVAPEVGAELLAALLDEDRPLWATALYAGLRYGELRALRWGAVDLASGTIHVRESWDPKEGAIAPKTRTSRRVTPVPGALRDLLLEHRLRRGEPASDELVFGREDGRPFDAATLYRRADRAWRRAELEKLTRAELDALAEDAGEDGAAMTEDSIVAAILRDRELGKPDETLRLHQARHTYASFMIAAGVNAKALATYMGHSSIKVTFDLYGHLMPGSEAEAAGLLDAFLERADSQARRAAVSDAEPV